MLEQLSLLELPLQPELAEMPLPTPTVNTHVHVNTHAIAWWEGKAAFYLRVMGKLAAKAGEKPQLKDEISRLHRLRQEALERAREYGCSS